MGNSVLTIEGRDKLQTAIDDIHKWAEAWQMKFNETKCKVVHFGNNNPKYTYTMNGTPLSESLCEKDVGVFINNDIKPSTHNAKAATKANTILGMMAKAFHYRDRITWIKLYKTYVRPHLEYASPAWNPWYRRDIELLEKVQERAVKMCFGLGAGTYHTN